MKRSLFISAFLVCIALLAATCGPTPTPPPFPIPTFPPEIQTQVAQTLTAVAFPSTATAIPAPDTPAPQTPAPESNIPVVQITFPITNQQLFANQPINVTGTAGDDAGIKSVLLYDTYNSVSTQYSTQQPPAGTAPQNFPFSIAWVSGQLGVHTLSVIAVDLSNNLSTPRTVTVNVVTSTNPPSAQILAPANPYNLNFGQTVSVSAQGADRVAVTRLDLYVDGALAQSAQSPNPGGQSSFTATLNWTANKVGPHNLIVRATNTSGNTADSAPALVVNVIDNIQPVISNTFNPPAPPVGPLVIQSGQLIALTSNAVDAAGIARIEFWADGVLTAQQVNVGTARFTWRSDQVGLHDLFTRAYDVGANSADSAHQVVQVITAPPPTFTPTPSPVPPTRTPTATPFPAAPSAYISAPRTPFNLPFPGNVRIVYGARGGAGLSSVTLYARYGMQEPFAIKFDSPGGRTQFDMTFDWRPPQPDNLSLIVEAYDTLNRKATASVSGVLSPPTPTPYPTLAPASATIPPPSIAGRWSARVDTGFFNMSLQMLPGCTAAGTCSFTGSFEDTRKAARGNLTRGAITGSAVQFEASLDNGSITVTFEGALSADGRTLSGDYTEAGKDILGFEQGAVVFTKQ